MCTHERSLLLQGTDVLVLGRTDGRTYLKIEMFNRYDITHTRFKCAKQTGFRIVFQIKWPTNNFQIRIQKHFDSPKRASVRVSNLKNKNFFFFIWFDFRNFIYSYQWLEHKFFVFG